MKVSAQRLLIGLPDSGIRHGATHSAADAFGESILVPGGAWPLTATFVRQGPDLLVAGQEGQSFVVRDYFDAGDSPDLVTEGGALLRAGLVERLAGNPAPAQFAQAVAPTSGDAVGRVEAVVGEAVAVRVDGTQVRLTAGDSIQSGDILQTGPGASLGVVFADNTTLSLGEQGRMVVDEFVFDPKANIGAMNVNVVQGVFTFVSGEIAKLGPDLMTVYTPVATIGIRGTKVAGRAAAEGEANTISLLANDDGSVGVIAIGNQSGGLPQILTLPGATTTVLSQFQAPAPPVILSPAQIQQQYGAALQTLNVTRQAVQSRPAQGQDQEPQQQEQNQEPGGGDQQGAADPGQPQPGGDGTQEEAAGRAAAAAVIGDGGTPAEALAAALEAATDQALANGASPEEVAAAEAAARAAFNEALANGQSVEAALGAAIEAASAIEFTQLAAAQSAGEGPLGPGPADPLARGEEGPVDPRTGDALPPGRPGGAGEADRPQVVEGPEGREPGSLFGSGDLFGPEGPSLSRVVEPILLPVAPIERPPIFVFSPIALDLPPPDVTEPVEPPPDIIIADPDPIFDDEFVATSASDTLTGGSGNTEYIYSQSEDGAGNIVATSGGGAFAGNSADFITDAGGGSDRITFEDLDGVGLIMTNLDSSFVTIRIYLDDDGSLASSALTGETLLTTIHISRLVEDLQASDSDLLSLGDGILVKDALDVDAGESAFALAGTAGIDNIAIDEDDGVVGAVLFGKGGADTLTGGREDDVIFGGADNDTINGGTGFNELFGGSGADSILVGGSGGLIDNSGTNLIDGGENFDTLSYASIDGSVIFGFNAVGQEAEHGTGEDFLTGIESLIGSANGDYFSFSGSGATGILANITGGSGDDIFVFESSVTVGATLAGSGGADDFLFLGRPSSSVSISGFVTGDKIIFADPIFNGDSDGDGAVDNGAFVSGAFGAAPFSATGTGEFFLFNTDDSTLYYDHDANGVGSAVAMAALGTSISDTDLAFHNVSSVSGASTVTLTSIADVIFASSVADTVTLSGAAGADDLFDGRDGVDSLTLANATNQIVVFDTETVVGGTGSDSIELATAMLQSDQASIHFVSGTFDALTLAAGVNHGSVFDADFITGSSFADEFHLNNNIAGATTVDLSTGVDSLHLAGGTNDLSVLNVETVSGSDSTDDLTLSNQQTGTTIDLGLGTDVLSLSNDPHSVTVANTETINGGSSTDSITLSGTTGAIVTGGASVDTVTLASGADILRYESSADGGGSAGGDTVIGFDTSTGGDLFRFLAAAFNGSAADIDANGVLDSDKFASGAGATAQDADDFFVFDTTTKVLSFDSDGNGGGAAVDIATVSSATLTADHITFA